MSAVMPPIATIGTSADAQASHKRSNSFLSLGKYREIIIAVGFFLLFDLGVLVLNFYISFQISEDATAINLAGRQRMLSQRTTKAIYAVEDKLASASPVDADAKELTLAIELFDKTLRAFKDGGSVTGGDGKPVSLVAVNAGNAQTIVAKAQTLWFPLLEKSRALLVPGVGPEQIADTVKYARENNTRLLGLMNDLTTSLEADAAQRASNLRWVQTIGIFLALVNFVFILMKFIRRLRASDDAAEAVAQENREILDSVKEGLFLLTPDFRIGSQIATNSHALFGRTVQPGESLFDLLKPLVSDKALTDAMDYVNLLFSKHVKEQLVQGINPLSEVEVKSTSRLGAAITRHLSFGFNRAHADGSIRHLLVTVQDITARKELELKLQTERSRAQKDFGMLLKAFEADPALLNQFVQRAERQLLEINDLLRSTSSASSESQVLKAVDSAFRHIHAFKGDAQALGLQVLADQAHQFEAELIKLKHTGQASGDALLALPLPLDELLSKISAFKELSKRRPVASAAQANPLALGNALEELVQQVAMDCGKRASGSVKLDALQHLPAHQQDVVREMATQLLRNAVAHGIEAPATRAAARKGIEGQVIVRLDATGDDQWLLSVRDDGVGLSAEPVRVRLRELGWYSAEALESFDDKQIMAHIFRPGFSTADAQQAGAMHAGRGVGLDIVYEHAKSLGAQIQVSSQPGLFTEFRVRFHT